jgi:hypothetical protein
MTTVTTVAPFDNPREWMAADKRTDTETRCAECGQTYADERHRGQGSHTFANEPQERPAPVPEPQRDDPQPPQIITVAMVTEELEEALQTISIGRPILRALKIEPVFSADPEGGLLLAKFNVTGSVIFREETT